jgi:hypothetical protein
LIPIHLNKLIDLPDYRRNILRSREENVDFHDFAATMAAGWRRRAIISNLKLGLLYSGTRWRRVSLPKADYKISSAGDAVPRH